MPIYLNDHINNYVGNFYGILLGYGASSEFGPYGFSGDERNRLRGIRVHDFHKDNVTDYVNYFSTYFKRAGADYGMCLVPDPADCNSDAYYPWAPDHAAANTESAVTTITQSAEDDLNELKRQRDRSLRAVGVIVNE